jgi:hypothetical protein
MKPYELPELDTTPPRPHWRRVVVGAAMLMALGALVFKLLTSCAWGHDETGAAKELAAAQLHTVSLATSIAGYPPVSVAQVDDLLKATRATLDRLRDEEARAWVMRDVIELDSVRQAWQLAEQQERQASALRGKGPLETTLAANWRLEAAEYRRRADAMLWRFRMLAPPQVPRGLSAAAPAASAAAAGQAASAPAKSVQH